MAITNEEREFLISVVKVVTIDHYSTELVITWIDQLRHSADKEEIKNKVIDIFKSDIFKTLEIATGTPRIRADISSIKDKGEEQQNEIDILKIFKQEMKLQINNILENNIKFVSQVLEYKTELDDTRKQLHKVSAILDNICNSGLFNCETIGKTLTSEPDLDGLSNIIH